MEEFIIEKPRWEVVGKYLPDVSSIRFFVEEIWADEADYIRELNGVISEAKQPIQALLKSYNVKQLQTTKDLLLIYILIKESFKSYKIESMGEKKQLSLYYNKIAKAMQRLDNYHFSGHVGCDGYKIKLVSNFPPDSEWYFEPVDDLPMPFKDKIIVKIFKHFEKTALSDYPGYISAPTTPENQIRKKLVFGFFYYLKKELNWKNQSRCEEFIESFSKNYLHELLPTQFKGVTSSEVQHTISRNKSHIPPRDDF